MSCAVLWGHGIVGFRNYRKILMKHEKHTFGDMFNTPLLWQVCCLFINIYICNLRWYFYVVSLWFFLLCLNNWRYITVLNDGAQPCSSTAACCGLCSSAEPQAGRCLTGSWTKVTTQSVTPATWFARCWRRWLISTPFTLSTETSR